MKNADRVDEVQRSLRNLSYKERLKRFGMCSLRRRRLRGDMIKVSKMIFGIDKVNLGKLFCTEEDERTRKHSLDLKIRRHMIVYREKL